MITSPQERRQAMKHVRFHFDKLNKILETTHPEQANKTENETTEDDIEKNQTRNPNNVATGDEPAPIKLVAKKNIIRSVPRQPVKAAREFVMDIPLPDFACHAGKFGARRREAFVPDRFKTTHPAVDTKQQNAKER